LSKHSKSAQEEADSHFPCSGRVKPS
jgi:hypothetical protein